jgi:5-methylcytosine-specific restriction endonuclease McrA
MDTTKLPTTRKEAQATGSKYYFTGEACKYGHIAPRKTKGACLMCLEEEWKKAAVTRTAYFAAYNRREDVKDRKNDWYTDNREQVIAASKTTPLHKKAQYKRDWKERNGVWVRADTKNRRRKHRDATPPWLTPAQKATMREMYKIAITMTQTTGEQYVVDHIVPLRSEEVCGLHVPWNLRVITQEENLKKSNKLLAPPTNS